VEIERMRINQLPRAALLAIAMGIGIAGGGTAHAAGLVISQVYGGGGNSGAPLHNDFIELFNAGTNAQNLGGWSVQYASSGGGTWNNAMPLPSVTLQPGEYFLIEEAAGAGGGAALPTPDVTGAINMSGTAGKIALVNTTTQLSGTCPADASIVDFIGYGAAASCAEGTHTGDLSNTTAAMRNEDGCADSDDNSVDFAIGAPAPRNSASPLNPCGGSGITLSIADVSIGEGDSGTTSAVFTVVLSKPLAGDVTFDIATADGTAVAGSDYVAASATAATIPAGETTYVFTVTVDGDTLSEPDETFDVDVSNVSGEGVTTAAAQATGTIVNDDPVHIYNIQGNGAHSPFLNSVTTATGEVTAIGNGGFFMQDAAGDDDTNTSDAIFVFSNDQNPSGLAIGSIATVTGRITEFFGMTEFTNSPPLTIDVENGKPTIKPIALNSVRPSANPATPYCEGSFTDADSVAVRNWRCLQSMRVTLDDGIVSAPNFFSSSQPLSEFYAYVAGQPRPYRGPGLGYGTVIDNPPAGYDPPIWDAVPYVFGVDTGKLLSPQAMNGGMHFTATGIMGFDFGIGILWPTSFAITDDGPTYPQPVAPSPAGYLTIGSQNMLRFFDDVANSPGIDDCANTNPGSSDVCPTPEQFDVRLSKLSRQVRDVLRAPAVLGVEEIENLPALQSLTDRIHADDAALTYSAHLVEGNDIGGIDVGFLVRSDVTINAVTQLGKNTQTTDGCGAASPCLLNDRPPLLLDASFGKRRFAVLVVHNRSLSGIDDPADGPRIRRKRLEQAQYVAAIVQSWQTGGAFPLPDSDIVPNPDAAVPLVVIGDYNGFQYTDGYVDVVGEIKGTAIASENLDWSAAVTSPTMVEDCGIKSSANPPLPYSFSFDGYVQELDHALFTNVAAARCMSVRRAHGNADVAEGGPAATDPSTAVRSADHDGFVVALRPGN
jgi:predicted extracellular nuclease